MAEKSDEFAMFWAVTHARAKIVREQPLMGLSETVAWIAIRDPIYCEAVRSYRQHEIEENVREPDAISEAVLWKYLAADAESQGLLKFGDAKNELFDAAQLGRIVGYGSKLGSNWTEIPKLQWIAALIIYSDAGDTLAPFASGMDGNEAPWGLVGFYRDEVLNLWPPIEAAEGGIATEERSSRYRRANLLRAGPTGPPPAEWVPLLITYFDTLMRPGCPGLDGASLDQMTTAFEKICRRKALTAPSRSRVAEYRRRYRNSDCPDSLPEWASKNSG